MTTQPSNNDDVHLPVAQSIPSWVAEDPTSATAQTATLLNSSDGVQTAEVSRVNNNEKTKISSSNNKPKSYYQPNHGFVMTSSSNENQEQQYWGRFQDRQAEVLPTTTSTSTNPMTSGSNDGSTPIVTARVDDRMIRHAFIRKVYMILSAQMIVTFTMCAFIALNANIRSFALGNAGLPMYWLSFIVSLVSICALQAYKRIHPHNYYILSIFTISMSYNIGVTTAIYETAGAGDIVIEAIFITATVFILLSLFTLQSKWDFSFLGAGLGIGIWILILWSIFGMIFGFAVGSVYALFGTILFSGYIIYDTYMIAERLDPEDYIVAAIELYLDIINLFLMILRLLSESNRN